MADIVVLLWGILCLFNVKYRKGKNNYWEDYLSKDNTLMLKGIFSIVVILHHLSQRFSPLPMLFKRFDLAGSWAVMVFFFISGYGVMYSWINKKNYDKGFLIKRYKRIVPLYIFATFVYWITYKLLDTHYSLKEIFHLTFIKGSPIVIHSWYIIVILVFYFFFYLLMKVFKRNYLAIIVSSFFLCFLWIEIRKVLNYGPWWSISILSIPIGMLWALYKEDIEKIVHRFYLPTLILSFVAFIFSWKYKLNNPLFYYLFEYGGNAYRQSLFFPITVILICMKFKFNNKALKHLGTISLETYLFHGLFVNLIFVKTGLPETDPLLYSLISILCSIALSSVIHFIYTGITKN